MNTCRTDSAAYHHTPNFNYVEPTDSQLKIEAEIETIEEFFVWSDDKLALHDKANEIIDFSDDLKESLMNIVIQAIGTDKVKPHTINQFIKQLQKTVKEFAATQLENQND